MLLQGTQQVGTPQQGYSHWVNNCNSGFVETCNSEERSSEDVSPCKIFKLACMFACNLKKKIIKIF